MALDDFALAAILGVIEGLTEFLPVSSTGHLILAEHLLGAHGERWKDFAIFIQLGAVSAVLFEWRRSFLEWRRLPRLALHLLLGFLPAAVVGLFSGKAIKAHLFRPDVVAAALLAGAAIILILERRPRAVTTASLGEMTAAQAFGVGLAQCLALIPGTSRAMATILGGMVLGLGRAPATEFSFLLAIPTLFAAGGYDLLRSQSGLSAADLPLFGFGFLVSFLVALLVVRWLVGYVRSHDFRPFAWWRIVLGTLVLLFPALFSAPS